MDAIEETESTCLTVGDNFGDYRVVQLLGRGGMGEVWLLENASGGLIAAKILDPTTANDHEARQRFLREAEFAMGVKHPNLVETYDVGEDPDTGLCYILMEYVPGGTLEDYLNDNGPMAVEDAVAVVEAMASVLELGREKGIVHRDIKPANIMFTEEGVPKLADLGIARRMISGTELTTVTQTGVMIGTPAYMAPEQMLDARHVDTRADIYSLGVVFFEMLTGERPHKDDTVVQLMARAVKGEPLPDVRTLRPEISASLAQLLSMMVAPDRDGRISTPGQISSALDIIERGGRFEADTVEIRRQRAERKAALLRRKQQQRRILISVCVATALAAIAGGIFAFRAFTRKPVPPPRPAAVPVAAAPAIRTNTVVSTVTITNQVTIKEKAMTDIPPVKEQKTRAADPVDDNDRNLSEKEADPSDQTEDQKFRRWICLYDPFARCDNRIYEAKVGKYTWKYMLAHGAAVITAGNFKSQFAATAAVSPLPVGHLTVPSELDGHPVRALGPFALAKNNDLLSVEIPEGVLALVGGTSLAYCRQLRSVKLPKSLIRISGWSHISNSPEICELDIRQCQYFDGYAINGCANLERFKCDPDNPTYKVDRQGVLYNRDLTTVIRCPGKLTSVKIPDSVTVFGMGSFYNTHVSDLTLPSNFETLRHCALLAPFLREIRFPKSFRRIDGRNLTRSRNLQRLIFEGDAPECKFDQSIFEGVPENLEILVREGTSGWTVKKEGVEVLHWPPNDPQSRNIRVLGRDEPIPPLPKIGTNDGCASVRADANEQKDEDDEGENQLEESKDLPMSGSVKNLGWLDNSRSTGRKVNPVRICIDCCHGGLIDPDLAFYLPLLKNDRHFRHKACWHGLECEDLSNVNILVLPSAEQLVKYLPEEIKAIDSFMNRGGTVISVVDGNMANMLSANRLLSRYGLKLFGYSSVSRSTDKRIAALPDRVFPDLENIDALDASYALARTDEAAKAWVPLAVLDGEKTVLATRPVGKGHLVYASAGLCYSKPQMSNHRSNCQVWTQLLQAAARACRVGVKADINEHPITATPFSQRIGPITYHSSLRWQKETEQIGRLIEMAISHFKDLGIPPAQEKQFQLRHVVVVGSAGFELGNPNEGTLALGAHLGYFPKRQAGMVMSIIPKVLNTTMPLRLTLPLHHYLSLSLLPMLGMEIDFRLILSKSVEESGNHLICFSRACQEIKNVSPDFPKNFCKAWSQMPLTATYGDFFDLMSKTIGQDCRPIFTKWGFQSIGLQESDSPAAAEGGYAFSDVELERLLEINPDKAAQKVFDRLFPGWRVSSCRFFSKKSGSRSFGYVSEFRGRRNLFMVIPKSTQSPARFTKDFKSLPASAKLYLSFCRPSDVKSDFKVEVRINGKLIRALDVSDCPWRDEIVDLNPWQGKKVRIEIRQLELPDQPRPCAFWSQMEVK